MKALLPALIAAVVALAAQPALAQWAVDPNAPLDVRADEETAYNTQTCVGELKGSVEINQGKVRLRAKKMVTRQGKRADACGSFTRLEADGDVFYVTPSERVRANRAVYDFASDSVTFTGDVIIVRGEDVATSDRLVINLKSNNFTLSGRTRSILYPNRTTP